jgi:hypothetical protein
MDDRLYAFDQIAEGAPIEVTAEWNSLQVAETDGQNGVVKRYQDQSIVRPRFYGEMDFPLDPRRCRGGFRPQDNDTLCATDLALDFLHEIGARSEPVGMRGREPSLCQSRQGLLGNGLIGSGMTDEDPRHGASENSRSGRKSINSGAFVE